MSRKSKVLSCALFLIVVAVVWIFWNSNDSGSLTRKLPDGSVLTLRSAYEKPRRIRTFNRWQDQIGMMLPAPWAKKLGCHFTMIGGGTNTLDFWLAWEGRPAGIPSGLRAAMIDEHGCESQSVLPNGTFLSSTTVGGLTYEFTRYPCRGKTLRFRLYEQATNGTWSTLTEFSLPNPDTRTHPVWLAEPLPITKSVGGVDLALTEMKAGAPASTDYPGASGAWATFQILEHGRPTAGWEFAGLMGISDALGHTVASGGYSSSMTRTGQYRVGVNAGLCLEETAWKVEAEFARAKEFPDDDLWTIRSVPVPERNTASKVEAVKQLHGIQLRCNGIVGVGCPEPRVRRSISGSPVAHIVCTNLPRDVQLKFVTAVDDRGRKVASRGAASEPPDYLYGLQLAPEAKTVDITFAVTKRVRVQYLVKPARFGQEELKKLKDR